MLTLILTIFLGLDFQSVPVQLSIASGLESEAPEGFQRIDEFTKLEVGQSYWVKVELSGEPIEGGVLSGGNSYMQNIRFYDSSMLSLGIGNHVTIREDSTYYLFYPFYDFKDPKLFSIRVESFEQWTLRQQDDVFVQIVFLSILSFTLLVTFAFVFGKDGLVFRNYAYYLGTMVIFFSYQYGFIGTVAPFFDKIAPSWIWIFSALISHGYLLFSRIFLDLKDKDPLNYRWTKISEYYIFGVIIAEALSLIFHSDTKEELWFRAIFIGLQAVLMIVYLYRIARMKTVLSNIFLTGSLVLLVSSLTGQIASVMGFTNQTNLYVQSGLLLDVFILIIGLATRYYLGQKSKDEVQTDLIEQLKINEGLQQEYTDKLEAKVSERTIDLDQRNRQNETLLAEVHHRVKNNLQMISSLLSMQQRRLSSVPAQEALSATKSRVKSIELIHEHLYRHDDFSKIDLKEYVSELIEILIKTLHKGLPIELELNIQLMKAKIETAIPIGLILNELITNSIKYGFRDNSTPRLIVEIEKTANRLVLMVKDNGKAADKQKPKPGFGHTIIITLLESLSGTMDLIEDSKGYQVKIEIVDKDFTT